MNSKILKSQAISYVIICCIILLMICVWPMGIISRNNVSKSDEILSAESEACNDEHIIAQVFVSEGTKLKSVDVYVCNEFGGNDIHFTLYDATLTPIYTKTMRVKENWKAPGFIHLPISLDVDRGGAYICSVSGGEEDLIVGLEDHLTTTNPSVYAITYDGMEDPEHNIIIRYNYAIGFTWWQIIIVDLILLAAGAGLIVIVKRLFTAKDCDKEILVHSVIRWVFNPIAAIITIWLLWMVYPAKLFSDKVINFVFWDLGIIIAAILAFYEINYKRVTTPKIMLAEYIKANFQNWLIAIAIANVLWYCFEYMNGFYDIHHAYACRRVLIWVMITVIATFNKKELCNIPNLIWGVLSIPALYLYAKPYIGAGEEELLYNLNAKVLYFGGFIVIYIVLTVIKLCQKKMNCAKVRWSVVVPTIIFLVGICALANTREWPGYMTAIFVILSFRLGTSDKAEKWLMNVCDGILLNFMMMLVFSLLHRPYYGYIYHRYNMCYFTVTMTATHLTLSLAAAGVKLYIKSRECENIRQLLPWIILFGTVANYMVFTMSRTGYLAVIVMAVVAVVIIAVLWGVKGKRFYGACVNIMVLVCSTIVLFPAVFTINRIIPAVNDDPVIYDYEPCMVTIYKGTPPDYEYYMDLPRFIDVFLSKVFGIGDAAVSIEEDIWYKTINQNEEKYLYASAGDDAMDEIAEIEEENEDLSNGRMDIYRSYISQSNMWGHDTMGAILDDGEVAAHAHSIYLQVIYDHGLIFGIYFALYLCYMWLVSVIALTKRKDPKDYFILVMVILTGFMTAGVVEWIFHPCNPFTMAVVMVMSEMCFNRIEANKGE